MHPFLVKPASMHRLKTFLLSLTFIISFVNVYPCGNEYYRSELPFYKGKMNINYLLNWDANMLPYWNHGFGHSEPDGFWEIREKLKKAGISTGNEFTLSWPQLEAALNANKDYKLLSDYAWYELRMGNKENAVKLLEALYAQHANEYNILANLGTAYEVTGNNGKALEFLRKAVAINPQSHYGSEWIHIKILEQKVATSPDYRLILDLNADKDPEGWLAGKVYNKAISADSLMVQLAFQLHERISFIAPPDPIVGQLVKDFADLVALTHSKKEAKEFYAFALKYDSLVMKPRPEIKITAKDATGTKPQQTGYARTNTISLLLVIIAVIAGAIWYAVKKKK